NPDNNFVHNQITTDQPTNNQQILSISREETSNHHVLYQTSNLVNQLPLQSQNIFQIDQDRHISTSDKADGISIILEPSEDFFKENSLNFDENLNDNNQISIGMFFPKTLYSQRAIFFIDNDRNNINPIYSREIHNLTSNVEVRNITSPITNILLPTSLMVGIVDQIISNNSNENTCITSTQPQISRTTGMNTFFKYF
ncbi:unnamed protein product, partial [Rotaria sp. Silwood2]